MNNPTDVIETADERRERVEFHLRIARMPRMNPLPAARAARNLATDAERDEDESR